MAIALQDQIAHTPARRTPRAAPADGSAGRRRRIVQLLLSFVTIVLLLNALVGERGLMEALRVRQQHDALVASIDRLRAENARLQEEARRLDTDPAAIEALARQELGLIRPGEVLFIIRDARPSVAAPAR